MRPIDTKAMKLACRFCSAKRGRPCVGRRGQPIAETHFQRRADLAQHPAPVSEPAAAQGA